MTKNVLAIAVLSAAIGLSVSSASGAPVGNTLEPLKASAGEASVVEQARHRHRRGYRRVKSSQEACWWADRWFCRYFW
jgi:hypothetical protein